MNDTTLPTFDLAMLLQRAYLAVALTVEDSASRASADVAESFAKARTESDVRHDKARDELLARLR